MVFCRSLQNQTSIVFDGNVLKFRHPWIQAWFYSLSKFLCFMLILCPFYHRNYGTSPPPKLFPVTPAAFVSGAYHESRPKYKNLAPIPGQNNYHPNSFQKIKMSGRYSIPISCRNPSHSSSFKHRNTSTQMLHKIYSLYF